MNGDTPRKKNSSVPKKALDWNQQEKKNKREAPIYLEMDSGVRCEKELMERAGRKSRRVLKIGRNGKGFLVFQGHNGYD